MENINLEGTINTRDLGGIVNRNNQIIKEHLILRGNNLSTLTTSDVEKLLKEYNLKTIIDLRSNTERKEKQDIEIINVENKHIPIFEESRIGVTHDKESDKNVLSLPNMEDLYQEMVTNEECIKNIKKIITTIMNQEEGSILYHCTAGKDRTGVITMLILSMLDVSEETILEDYLYTNVTFKEESEKYYKAALQRNLDNETCERIRKIFLADEKYLSSAINAIKEKYESVINFIKKKLEITEEDINKFKDKVLDK